MGIAAIANRVFPRDGTLFFFNENIVGNELRRRATIKRFGLSRRCQQSMLLRTTRANKGAQ